MSTCCTKEKFRPLFFEAGTTLPINIPILFSIGKWPFTDVQPVDSGNNTTSAPLIVPSYERDADFYVTSITLNPAPDTTGTLDKDTYVIIHPDFIY